MERARWALGGKITVDFEEAENGLGERALAGLCQPSSSVGPFAEFSFSETDQCSPAEQSLASSG